jgi:hypothetical protein
MPLAPVYHPLINAASIKIIGIYRKGFRGRKKEREEGVRKERVKKRRLAQHHNLRACSNCGFFRSIDRKKPDFRALLEPAR